jgi:hypothetical protein
VLLSEVPPEEHASALGRLRVICDAPKPSVTLVTKCLELRHEIAGASSEELKGHRDDNATLLIALDEASLLKIRQQCLTNPHRYAGRVRERCRGRGSALGRPSGERGLEPLQVPDGRTAQRLKPFLDVEVGRVEQEDAVRRASVARPTP